MFNLGTVVCSTYDKTIRGPIVGYGVIGWNGEGNDPVYLVQVAPASSALGPACRVIRHSHTVLAADVDRQALPSNYCPEFVNGNPIVAHPEMCTKPAGHDLHESEHWTWESGGVPEYRPKA